MLMKALLCVMVAWGAAANATLSGTVSDESGEPLENATVSVYSAKPRDRVGTLGPARYRDCDKFTSTANDGTYLIDGLDSSMLFRVLVAAPGRRSALSEPFDPNEGPYSTQLRKLPTGLRESQFLNGRVVDRQGRPIAGAIIYPFGAKTSNRRWWGRMPGVESQAISNGEGRFVVVSEQAKLGMDLRVSGRDYATTITPLFELNGKEHEVRLVRGAHVTGRLSHLGNPVAGRVVGIVQASRNSDSFVGETVLATNERGIFRFNNLQANEEYVLYALCEENGDELTFRTKPLTTGADDETLEVGEIELTPGLRFAGRVIVPEGHMVPKDSTVRLSRDPAWDGQTLAIGKNGQFQTRGLPSEVYSIRVHVDGWEIDTDRFNYQMVRGGDAFGLRLGRDRLEFSIPLRVAQ